MTRSSIALPLSLVLIVVSSLSVTGQEQVRRRLIDTSGQPNPPSQQAEILNSNYRITFSGKSDDKSLGELSSLTCSPNIVVSGPLDSSETPTSFSVTGALEERDGLILFSYQIQFTIPMFTTTQQAQPASAGQAPAPAPNRHIQYMTHSSSGILKMKPGKTYDLLKVGGNVYTMVVAPEIDEE